MAPKNNKSNTELSEYLKSNKITKCKPESNIKRYKRPYTGSLPACPECGSKLVVSNLGVISCSGDKLKVWYNKFLEYDKASNASKLELLKSEMGDQFMPLYERWKYKDQNNNRTAFECLYSTKLHSPTPSYEWYIADPFQTKRLEKILGRKLVQNEIDGLLKVSYQDTKGNIIEEQVVQIRFPWELM